MTTWPARLGVPGAVALLALAATLVLAGACTPRWLDDASQLQAQRPPPPAPAQRASTATMALPALPPGGEPAERVAALLRLAARHRIAVDVVQQRAEPAAGIPNLQLDLAVRGRYADLRALLSAALAADPALALDRLVLRRPAAGTDLLEAELRWLLLQPRGSST